MFVCTRVFVCVKCIQPLGYSHAEVRGGIGVKRGTAVVQREATLPSSGVSVASLPNTAGVL